MKNAVKILKRIRADEIRPNPRWKFITKRVLIWSGLLFTILFGAISFSVILYVIQEAEYDLLEHASHSRLELILTLMPVIWIVFLAVFLSLSILSFRNAPKGYKYTFRKIFGVTTILSVILGAFCFVVDGGKFVEQTFEASIGSYRGVQQRKIEIWSNPNDGRISGQIRSLSNDTIELNDFNDQVWLVTLIPDAFVASRVKLVPGEKVKLIGSQTSDAGFEAEEVRPWGSGQGKGRKHRRR